MKKVFLSLATIAFVAVGSLTVTSCGGDDSTPNPGGGDDNPPVTSSGKLKVDGTDHELDLTQSFIYGAKNAQGQNVPVGYRILPSGATDSITVTRWAIDSFNGDSAETADNYHTIEVFVPVNGTSVVYPHQSETLIFAGAGVKAGGTEVDLGQLTAFDLNIDVFENATEGAEGSITFTSSLTGSKTATVDYKGKLDGTYIYVAQSGKNSKFNKLNSSVKVNNISDLKISK